MPALDPSPEPELAAAESAANADPLEREIHEYSRALWPFSPTFFALLSVLSVVVAAGLAPALPGSRTGIDIWITRLETGSSEMPALAAWLTQLTLICGIWLCSLLLQKVLGERRLAGVLRVLTALTLPSFLVFLGLLNVTRGELGEPWILGVAASCALLAGACAVRAMLCQATRAAGLVLMLVTLAGSINAGAHVLALSASEQAHAFNFTIARVLATTGLMLDTAAAVIALGWFLSKTSRARFVILFALLSLASILVLEADRGALDGASFWQVLSARALNELTTHPDPLLLMPLARNFLELLNLSLGLGVLLRPKTLSMVRAAVALALASRGNIDVPLSALMLASGGLLAVLSAAMLEKPARSVVNDALAG